MSNNNSSMIETDCARRQQIANSIDEGRLTLRTGQFNGRKLSTDELLAVRRNVQSDLAKLGDKLAGKIVSMIMTDVTPEGFGPSL